MNIWLRAWVTGLAGLALFACDKIDTHSSSHELKTEKDKISYAIGLDIGRSFKHQSLDTKDVDLDKMRAGIVDVLSDAKLQLADSQVTQIMTAFQQQIMARQDSVNRKKGEENKKVGDDFLAKNGKESGVITLPSGLQYKILTEGKGPKPDSTSTVSVHYTGTLLDGTEFDSSIKRGQPATFPVNGVIKGWTQALQLMPTGSKWKLFIPSELAYGPRGAGQKIGPNSALIFEVELLTVAETPKVGAAGEDMHMNPHMKQQKLEVKTVGAADGKPAAKSN